MPIIKGARVFGTSSSRVRVPPPDAVGELSRRFFHLGFVFGGAGGAVALGAVEEGGLCLGDICRLSAPGVEGGFLEGPTEGEAESPWSGAELVEGVEVLGGADGALAAGEEHNTGDGRRDGFFEGAESHAGGLFDGGLLRCVLAGENHVGLEHCTLEKDAMFAQGVEKVVQRGLGDFEMALNGMIAIHENFGFDDGHKAGFLAEGGVSGESMRIGLERETGGVLGSDFNDGAPLGKASAKLGVFGEAVAQSVEALSDAVTRKVSEGFGTFIDLDAGNDVLALEEFDHGCAISGFLANGFVVKNDAADEFTEIFGGEEEGAVIAAVFFRGANIDALQALRDGAGAFVRSENSLAGRSQSARGGLQIFLHIHLFHKSILRQGRQMDESPCSSQWTTSRHRRCTYFGGDWPSVGQRN